MRNFTLLALAFALVACRDTGGGDDTQMPDGNPSDVTIQEIQNDAMPDCKPATPEGCVELKIKGVVVTAIDSYGGRTGDFWVQEPSGGPFSGVQVFGAPVDQVAGLAIGDVIDIAGAQKAEFALSSDMSGNKLTELEPVEGGMMTITKTGANMPVQPQVVDALAIGQMTDFMARNAEWEKWEGVLVKLDNVEAFSGTSCIGSSCPDMTYRQFDITGDIKVQSSLAAMPMPEVARGDCLSGVTGIIGYFFDYQILPRTTGEIGTGGNSCPVENNAATCGDGLDNNGNGFSDCMDFSCQTTVPACVQHPTIAEVQSGSVTGYVKLDTVYVTAVSFNKKNLWVATSLTAAPNEAIYVFRGNATSVPVLDAQIVVGAQVSVEGLAQEGNNDNMGATLTQIAGTMPTVTFLAAATTPPVPVVSQMASALAVESTGEPYESVLVTLTNVKITVAGTSANFYTGELQQGSTKFISDDDVLRLTDPVNTCYATVTGIWTYQIFSNAYGLLPISTTAGGTCP
jgi:hypothetical protein